MRTILLDTQLQAEVTTGPLSHTVLGGIDYKHFSMDQVQTTGLGPSITVVNPEYGERPYSRTPHIDQTLRLRQVGFYLQDQMRFGDGWLVTLNGRYDRLRNVSSGSSLYHDSERKLSGRAGVAYTFDTGLTPYASVSSFFNPLLRSQQGSIEAFVPETGTQYEVGLKYAPRAFPALFTLALFDLTRYNVVTGPRLDEAQLSTVNSRGMEVEARADLTDNLSATAAFTWLDLDIIENPDPTVIGKTPYVMPETQASASLDYTMPSGVFGGVLDGVVVGAGVRYVGSSWADHQNTVKVPAVTLYDGWIGYEAEGWGLDLTVSNLTDEAYVAGCQTVTACFYGEGLTARLGLHVSW